jgi:phosphopantetheine adenylyltransferase
MQEKQQPEHKQGPPWKVVKKTTTYDDAVDQRDKIVQSWVESETTDMQIKIRRMNDPAGFTIRTRLDPEVAEERKKAKSSKGKKKSKAKKPPKDKSDKSD